ncbi:MAG TPA: hypothetical protein VFI74_06300 [Candidatus Saccharimonadales bacterium]|nr:hypothetical protein [Candidatus Saccharimonadales bacterium]
MEARLSKEQKHDPQLQQMLAFAVQLGEGITTAVYDEHKRRQQGGEPPESYFATEERLRVAFAGEATLLFPERDGFESAKVETRPAIGWPDGGVLTVRHSVRPEEGADNELYTAYYITSLGEATLQLTIDTEDATERNALMRARKGEGEYERFHEDWAVHLEIVNIRLAGINSARFYARKEQQESGEDRGNLEQAQGLLALLAEGVVQMPSGQQ